MNHEKYKKINFGFFTHDACPVCQGAAMIPNGKFNWLDTDFWYVICPDCGLKFMNPMPTRESYQNFYKNLFWQQKIRNLGYHKSGQAWQAGQYKWDNDENWDPDQGRQNRIDKHREQRPKIIIPVLLDHINLNHQSKILEIGCGYGVTLEELHNQYQSHVYALEPSEDAIKIMEEFGKIQLLGSYAEELEDLSKKDLKFDAIIFSHILENTVDPLSIIKFAKQCLAKSGIIYIQTPNLTVNDQMNPYHPYIFSPNSLRVLAGQAGLKFKQISKTIDRMLTVVCFQ